MDKVKQLIVPALTALVVALLVSWVLMSPHKSVTLFGTATTPGSNGIPTVLPGGSQPTYLNALEASESFISDGPSYLLGSLNFVGTTAATGYSIQPTVTSCNGTASSTQFSVTSPFGSATSTVISASIVGANAARSTDFIIGTSTTPAVTATTSIGAQFISMAAISSGGQFNSIAGTKVGPGTGYQSPTGIPSSATNASIMVGPSEKIVGYATSTAPTGGFGVTSCTLRLLWMLN